MTPEKLKEIVKEGFEKYNCDTDSIYSIVTDDFIDGLAESVATVLLKADLISRGELLGVLKAIEEKEWKIAESLNPDSQEYCDQYRKANIVSSTLSFIRETTALKKAQDKKCQDNHS